jgi:hypothetical protein
VELLRAEAARATTADAALAERDEELGAAQWRLEALAKESVRRAELETALTARAAPT